jgi:hypothetical protein
MEYVMARVEYQELRMQPDTIELIEQADIVLCRLAEMGYRATLRQCYYQLVKANIIPNNINQYNRLKVALKKGRLCGMIDWDHIEDRARQFIQNTHWTTPGEIIESAAEQFKINRWKRQDYYVEVWIEKDALSGVIEPVCLENDVGFFACRGYASVTTIREAALRFKQAESDGKEVVVLHMGDHDSSGVDMTRDICDRIELLVGHPIDVDRIALTLHQAEERNLPPQPAKNTDVRTDKYREEYGDGVWELDALDPPELVDIVQRHINEIRDPMEWDRMCRMQEELRNELRTVAEHWAAVAKFAKEC